MFFFRNDFKDFSLHSRLHFRIQAAQDEIKQSLAGETTGAAKNGLANNKGLPVSPARKPSFKADDVVLPLPVDVDQKIDENEILMNAVKQER